MEKLKVGFVCVGNSCRSQMAEGFAKHYGKNIINIYSAGTYPALQINQNAIYVMKEVGIDLSNQYPKLLSDIPLKLDILVTMGCNVQCPYLPCKFKEDWGIEDPVGKSIEVFKNTRNIIKKKVKNLVEKINAGYYNK